MAISITKRYHFEAAHWLPLVHENHKCHRIHGHNYEIEISVEAALDKPVLEKGFVIDFWDLDEIVHPLVNMVDHRTLNDIPGLDNPTAELIALWFYERVQERLMEYGLNCVKVIVYETKDCCAMVIPSAFSLP